MRVGLLVSVASVLALGACSSQPSPDGAPTPVPEGGAGPSDGSTDAWTDASPEASADATPDAFDPEPGRADASADAGDADAASKGDPYNFAPPSRTVRPVAVYSTSGQVTDPANVLTGKVTRLTGAGAQIVLDFGKEVGGVLSLQFSGASDTAQK